jgi:multidrug efflux pump subunit AcrA (membrane-fusion protein)
MFHMRKFLKKPIVIIIILIIAVILALLYWRYGRQTESAYESVAVERRLVFQEVSVTGRVKPLSDANLAFERGGRIAKVNVKIGDTVTVGQVLIELDTRELVADLNKAEAALRSAYANRAQYEAALETQQAKLEELKRGTRPEELAVSETKVLSARQTLADAEVDLNNTKHQSDIDLANLYDNVPNILNDAYAKADDAVTKQTDEFFSDDNTNPKLTFVTSNSQAQIDVERQRLEMTAILASFRADLDTLPTDQTSRDEAMARAESRLVLARDFLTRLSDTVNTSTSLSQTTVTTYKGYLNTARTNLNTAITSVSGQRQSITSKRSVNQDNISTAEAKVNQASNALTLAEDELTLKRSGATTEQLKAKEAEVRQAAATLSSQEAAVSQAAAAVENLRD